MDISLARVLKVKKILTGKLAKTQQEIQLYNSVIEGTEQPNIRKLVEQREELVAHLLDIKSMQVEGNAKIQRTLFELAEAKSSLTFWKGIDTTNGDTGGRHYGTDAKIVRQAVVKKEEKETKVAELEKQIEDLQEQVDQYNFGTKINVSDALMASAGLKR